MVGAWAWIQLFLGCTLLLGQPVGATVAEDSPSDLGDLPEEMENTRESVMEESVNRLLSNMGDLENPGDPIHQFIDHAQDFLNRDQFGSESLFKITRIGEIKARKLIGNTIYLKMFLAKTNCTMEDVEENRSIMYRRFDSEGLGGLKHCDLPEEFQQEKLDCDFQLFQAPRSFSSHVMDHSCKPLLMIRH